MKWLILLLVALGGAVYMGYIRVPLPADSLSNKGDSVKADSTLPSRGGASKGGPHSETIRTAAQSVLLPLESQQTGSVQIAQTLDKLRAQITAPGNQQDGAREAQALALLSQALMERTAILTRIRGGSSGHDPLDHVPGNWHVAGHPEKTVDLTAANEKWRSSFWAQAEIKKWNERREYYWASIQALLAPQAPAH